MESKDKLPIFFASLDLEPIVIKLRSQIPQGAIGYSREGILRAILAAPLEGIATFTGLVNRLKSDIRFRYQCGLGIGKVPSISTFSRVFKKIVKANLAEELFTSLVQECLRQGVIDGKVIAIDSTAIEAYEKKQPRSRSKETGNADWGVKKDSFNNKVTWFGYKLHIAVDATSELPLAFEVTPANINDGDIGPVLIEKVTSIMPQSQWPKYYSMDSGYDQHKNYEAARKARAQAIIPLNPRNEKEPPAGMTANGTPVCSMNYPMVYWGADKEIIKFRCPHVLGKVNCPFGSAWCSDSNYGMVEKINITDDLRRYSLPHRDTRKWKELYNRRTAVERVNSRLKDYLTADQIHVCGIQKAKTYITLNLIILLAGALASRTSTQRAA